MKPLFKAALLVAAAVAAVIGLVGLIVPLLPGVPLLILAVFLLARGSDTARARLGAAHRRFRARHALTQAEGLDAFDRIRLRFWQAMRVLLDAAGHRPRDGA